MEHVDVYNAQVSAEKNSWCCANHSWEEHGLMTQVPPSIHVSCKGVVQVVMGILLLPLVLAALSLAFLVKGFEHPKNLNDSGDQDDSNQQLEGWEKELSQVCLEFTVSGFSVV